MGKCAEVKSDILFTFTRTPAFYLGRMTMRLATRPIVGCRFHQPVKEYADVQWRYYASYFKMDYKVCFDTSNSHLVPTDSYLEFH